MGDLRAINTKAFEFVTCKFSTHMIKVSLRKLLSVDQIILNENTDYECLFPVCHIGSHHCFLGDHLFWFGFHSFTKDIFIKSFLLEIFYWIYIYTECTFHSGGDIQ